MGMGGDILPGRLHLLLVSSHQPRVPILVGGPCQSSLVAAVQSVDRSAPILDQCDRRDVDSMDSPGAAGFPAHHDSGAAGIQSLLSVLDPYRGGSPHAGVVRIFIQYPLASPCSYHASNPRYLDRNYAGVLMVWDRLFGTFVAERDEEPPRYGIVKNIESFNPIRIAFP